MLRFAVLLALAVCGTAGAQTNLIVNGNAETVTTSTTVLGTTSTTSPPGWVGPTDPTVKPGAVEFYTNGFPVVPAPGPNNRGLRLFTGGVSTTAQLRQTIALVGKDGMPFTLCGFLGGYASQNDNATVTAKFEDGASMPTGADASIGPVLAGDRQNVSGLCLRSISGTIPAGTTQVEIVIDFNNLTPGGPYNDGYVDNLHFELAPICPENENNFPCTTTTTTTTTSTSTTTTSTTTTSTTTTSTTTSSSTTTTTTTTATSSTTTLPGSITPVPCPTGVSFDAIDCRFTTLLDDVTGAPDLGGLHDKLRTLVADAKTRFEGIPTASNTRKAKTLAKVVARKLAGFSHRVTSRAGKK